MFLFVFVCVCIFVFVYARQSHTVSSRALEEGDLTLAADRKDYLETKQRDFRKEFKNKKEADWWTPKWFVPCKNPATGEDDWRSTEQFWTGDFTQSPRIF